VKHRSTARKTAALLASALVVLGLASCAFPGGNGGGAQPRSITGSWQLTAASDSKGDITTKPAVVTLNIDGAKSGGHGPCNSFGATTHGTTTGAISIVVGVHTEMACSDQELNAAEERYFDALGKVTKATITNDRLTLTGDGDQLDFARATK
jgi:heat shock protein HslJ